VEHFLLLRRDKYVEARRPEMDSVKEIWPNTKHKHKWSINIAESLLSPLSCDIHISEKRTEISNMSFFNFSPPLIEDSDSTKSCYNNDATNSADC